MIPGPIQNTLFGKFFYSSSLFVYHSSYKNKVFDITFQWNRYPYNKHTNKPYYRSIVTTKLVTEIIDFDQEKNIISYESQHK